MSRTIKESVSLDEVADSNAVKKTKESKRDESFTKKMMYGDKAYQRTVRATQNERDAGRARLHPLGGEGDVEMFWDFSDDAIRQQVFRLKVGDKITYLSAVELQKSLRWV